MPDIKRKCNSCGLEATTEEQLVLFEESKTCKYGRRNRCKECASTRLKKRHLENKEQDLEKMRTWYGLNRDQVKEQKKKWRKGNKHKINAYGAKRRAIKLQATPSWANHAIIEGMYAIAARRGQHVDHIVPLINDLVCGLHVEDNLQLLEPIENLRKGNTFHV